MLDFTKMYDEWRKVRGQYPTLFGIICSPADKHKLRRLVERVYSAEDNQHNLLLTMSRPMLAACQSVERGTFIPCYTIEQFNAVIDDLECV